MSCRVRCCGVVVLLNEMICRGVKSGNAQLSKDIASWVFQESLVLRIDSVSHHKVNETEAPETYTVNDHAVC